MRDFISEVLEFNRAAGRPEKFDDHQAALHMGLQLEELAEKLKAVTAGCDEEWMKLHAWRLYELIQVMDGIATEFKKGNYDNVIASGDRHEMLDADIDVCVVSLGSMMTCGAQVVEACLAVSGANLAKRFEDGTFHKDVNAKIMKPQGWKPADLTPYVGK